MMRNLMRHLTRLLCNKTEAEHKEVQSDVVEDKYEEWSKKRNDDLVSETINGIFDEMEPYELEYFRDFCMRELIKKNVLLSQISRLIFMHEALPGDIDTEAEIGMHCEISHEFSFFYNKMCSIPKSENGFRAIELFLSNEKLNELFLDGYEYEVRKRFANDLEIELPNHDKPKPKRIKI